MANNIQNLKILYWNCQSIYCKFIETFEFLTDNDIDVALFSETWLKPKHSLYHPNYKIYRVDRIEHEHGGIAIAIKNNIKHTYLPSFNTEKIESAGISIDTLNGHITLVSVYFPGTKHPTADLPIFKKDLDILTNIKNSYFICGDFNAKHRYWNCLRANTAGNILYSEMTRKHFVIHHPFTPTNFPPQSRANPSTIDLILSNSLHNISQPITHDNLNSDHLPVTFTIDCNATKQIVNKEYYSYNDANWIAYKMHINANTCLKNFRIESVAEIDEAIIKLNSIILEAKNKAVPLKILRHDNLIKLPDHLKRLIRIRNSKRRIWQRTRLPEVNREYKHLCRLITHNVFQLKNQHWNSYLRLLAPHSKNFWHISKKLRNKSLRLPPLKVNGNYLFTDKEKVDAIAQHFRKSHELTLHNVSPIMQIPVENSISQLFGSDADSSSVIYTKPKEIKNIIRNFKNKKAPGNDGIQNTLLKNLPKKALIFLTHLYNACIKFSYFPTAWKHANVIAIPKPNKNQTDPKSYRPISLLTSFSKILEKILLQRINNFIEINKILPDFQFGFRPGHSTSQQLVRVVQLVKNDFRNKRSTGMLTLDIEKAFDCVWHDGLLHKMTKLKFPVYIIKCIQSFLKNRSFSVQIGKDSSLNMAVPAGVPQGSCLSPTLYNIFTSDIPIPDNCELAMYADDTAILTSSNDPKKIIHNLEKALSSLDEYYTKWKIQINTAKTQSAFFTKRRSQRFLPHRKLQHNGFDIEWQNDLKYLGIILDKKLIFAPHVLYTTGKTQKFIRILYPLINRKSLMHTSNKLLLYTSVLRPILTYGCPVWGKCAPKHLKKIQIVQNKILKIIMNLPYFHRTSSLHTTVNIPYIEQFINKISHTFYSKNTFSENPLVSGIENVLL